jgi:hypothetical protein
MPKSHFPISDPDIGRYSAIVAPPRWRGHWRAARGKIIGNDAGMNMNKNHRVKNIPEL